MTSITADQRPRRLRELRRGGILAAVGVLAILTLAACGSSSTSTPAAASASPTSAAARPGGAGGVPGPAAYGVAAAISGSSIEVQDPATGQVTVTYSDATTWTQSTQATTAALAVGDCVTVTGTAPASTGTASTTTRPTSFTATAITVIDTTNGTCAATGFGNGTAPRTGTRASSAPTGTPRTRTGTGGGGGGAGFAFATGTVQSVSGATIVIDTVAQAAQGATIDTVTTTGTTTVTTTAPATSAALTVGECVSANGATSPNGSVSATRIALSTPGPSGCTTGFGRRGPTGNGSPSA